MSIQKHIKDLIFFYVKINYNEYLKDKNIETIEDEEIDSIINMLYDERKEHIKIFILKSLQKLSI